jgi:hypothetical protein
LEWPSLALETELIRQQLEVLTEMVHQWG